MREIEIKLKVDDSAALEEKLKKAGCVLSEPIRQHDVVYSNTSNPTDFTKSTEGQITVRIRKEENRAELNLKQQRTYEMDNIEHESEIKNPDAVHKMLEILNWKPEVEVRKMRKQGRFGDYTVCLDEVEELGNFIELEKITDDDDDPGVVRKELFKVAESLGLSESNEEIRGYDTQIYQLRNKN